MKLFCENKPLYKGNLHTHTKLSDGRKPPEEVIELYKSNGYSFLAITDHRKKYPKVESDDFVIIPAGEYHHQPGHTAYHIVALGLKDDVITDDTTEPQEIINRVRAAGGMPVIAHPAWSLMTPDEAMDLEGWEAVEIFNGISEGYANRGYSIEFVDAVATRGCLPLLLSSDDVHFFEHDLFQGWIVAQPDEFTSDSILEAIRAGRFYASTGPEIHQLTVEDGVISVETSEAERICFMSNVWYTATRTVRGENGAPVTSASYTPGPKDKWVRVEVVDKNGKRAFSNFIKLEKTEG
ncbi:MAG: CehA/McbA family metallohydrolase [Clostridia bacterium]|nr:CehA/McbA family metallohydrolase [Clostridia bacterium]